MAWQKGQSGNSRGRLPEKLFADQVRLVVNEEDPARGKRKLRCLAERLYEDAMKGEGWAMCQIADRLDGKPAQESTVTVRSELDSMTDAELREFIRRELAASGDSGAEASQQSDSRVTH